ncbi:translation initiation factor IF-2 [Candidatus Ishikawella capsulata]|uniref:Translation initiation factor IF-2 n=1 Tax=Candidatus Ishikawaella capsulata Mpkobe TaxID=476281 RepID=C5WCU1_9ENTR|nr:translation initiation factor IF-2 [Candidatus Ishikawaella capsulata]BAH83147.1 translation initiation factor IF-2 [Candidatus Ishikawaella capsulata Mpkobe]
MTDVTIKSLAEEIKTPLNILLKHFAAAGICKSANDSVNQQEREILLCYLNNEYENSNKLTLQRKTRSTLNITSTTGKDKYVQVEVRKKRTYIKSQIKEPISQIRTKLSKEQTVCKKTDNILKAKLDQSAHKKIVKTVNEKIAEKYKVKNTHPKEDNKTSHSRESSLSVKVANLKHKVEGEVRRKIEENARRVVEETRRVALDKTHSWKKIEEQDNTDYHLMTSHHARQAEDENDQAIENMRIRPSKLNRSKKSNKHSEAKIDREEAKAAIRVSKNTKHRKSSSSLKRNFNKPKQTFNRIVQIGETVTVAELAIKMAVKSSELIKCMMNMGIIATINQVIDQETAQIIAEEMGHKVILRYDNELESAIMNDRDTGNIADLAPRAPVVTIMGHVDHGKTSLLDYIRSTKIASGEAGGITQHIGAYHVETENGMITFLDTPGHAAFTAMRARGIKVTDIVILVVAADDGVMPQTIEAIQHAKAAGVPVIVAINKIDKLEANIDRVKNELSKYDILPEEWGGENTFVNVSAKIGTGIDTLLQSILLQAEILELTAVFSGMANGIVIESCIDKGRGPVATVLVRSGILNKGDVVLCGLEYGRVRAMRDELGKEVSSAGPSIPVEIFGLSGIAATGDEAIVVRDEKKAREVALYRQSKLRENKFTDRNKSTLENMFSNLKMVGDLSELNIVLKADVQGSVEAISDSLLKLSNEEVEVKIVGSGVGGITETDATLAAASNAIILGFNVRADSSARYVIESQNLTLRYYSVIYDLINEVKSSMSGMLSPEYKQQIIGMAEVRNVFKSTKFGSIAGCMVIEGIIKRSNPIRIIRDNIVIYEGELESLRRFKEDVNEVRSGMECGIGVKNYKDIREKDIIEVFKLITVKRIIN